jgi:hypothetical protein
MRSLLGLMAIVGAGLCLAQEPPPRPPVEGARDLFFAGAAPKDALPPVHKTAAPKPAPAPALGALHLGLRYTLLLVTARGERGQPVAPERNFRKGECVAIEMEANRSGYLYVLSKQSSGDWVPLFPTPELSDQSNRIDPGEIVRTPKRSCFAVDDPPGIDTLFVVLSRDPRDIYELSESIQGPGAHPQPSPAATEIASAGRINSAVDRLGQEYGTRDLPFRQVVNPTPVAKPAAARTEPEHAVYVVNGAAKPAATLVTKVEIIHR